MKLDKNYYLGKVFSGGYKIQRFIGSGAFAFVYLATDPHGRQVAVKVQYNHAEDALIRFNREIKVLKELPKNDFLVSYHGDGVTPENYPYLIMEFVDGITLKDALKAKPIWPINESCHFLLQLCDAFGGLHLLGLAHRDVKPDNIMFNREFKVKLMDFGLIKDAQGLLKLFEAEDIMSGRDFAENLDKGVIAGTPEYMAPEQFSDPSLDDETQTKTDTWTDVYSLGLIFYEMLTGKKLFPFTPDNSSPADYARSLLDYLKIRTEQNDADLIPPANIPYQLWTIIARALHAEPTLRQRTSATLAEDIRRYLVTGEGVAEQDSEKTCAIDLANFANIIGNQRIAPEPVNYPSLPFPPAVTGPPPPPTQFPSNPNIHAYGSNPNAHAYGSNPNVHAYSSNPNVHAYGSNPNVHTYYGEPQSEDNLALWIILIIILIIVIGVMLVWLFLA
ncbi:MAG: serine/threonine-protein kinase [Bradymonadales bacterium]